jgi:transcription antitermination factor NusA-like protein|tara:strand:+ start:76 stop:279 length:204 start_codon:yes stop_codon:yes gene_type:complete
MNKIKESIKKLLPKKEYMDWEEYEVLEATRQKLEGFDKTLFNGSKCLYEGSPEELSKLLVEVRGLAK